LLRAHVWRVDHDTAGLFVSCVQAGMDGMGVKGGQELRTLSHVQAVLSWPDGRFESEGLVHTSNGVPNIAFFITEGQFAQATTAMPLEISLSSMVTKQASEFLRNINCDGDHLLRVT